MFGLTKISLLLATSVKTFSVVQGAKMTGYIVDNLCLSICEGSDGPCAPDGSNTFFTPELHTGWCKLLGGCEASGYSLMSEYPGDDGKHQVVLSFSGAEAHDAVLDYVKATNSKDLSFEKKVHFPLVKVAYADDETVDGIPQVMSATITDPWDAAVYTGDDTSQAVCMNAAEADIETNNMCMRSDIKVSTNDDKEMFVIESSGCPDHGNMKGGSGGTVPNDQVYPIATDDKPEASGGDCCASCGSCCASCGACSGKCDSCSSCGVCSAKGCCSSCSGSKECNACAGICSATELAKCDSISCAGSSCASSSCAGSSCSSCSASKECSACAGSSCSGSNGTCGVCSGVCSSTSISQRELNCCASTSCNSCSGNKQCCGSTCGASKSCCGSGDKCNACSSYACKGNACCSGDKCGACSSYACKGNACCSGDKCGACGSCSGDKCGACGACGACGSSKESGEETIIGDFDPMYQHYIMMIPQVPGTPGEAKTIEDGVVGLMTNGVLLDTHEQTWSYDECTGHSDTKHQYHYHLPPTCFLKSMGVAVPEDSDWWMNDEKVRLYEEMSAQWPSTGSSPVVGFARDGFPIKALYDSSGALQRSQVYDGELDECNGKTDSDGYAYYLTAEPPFVPTCLRGEIGSFSYSPSGVACPKDGITNVVAASSTEAVDTDTSDAAAYVRHGLISIVAAVGVVSLFF